MKLKYWALSLLACGGMLSCSNNDDITDDGGCQGGDEKTTSYVAVNLVNPLSGTRAAEDKYENGTNDENKITSARFYFFDASGNPYTVRGVSSVAGSTDNYLDISVSDLGDGTVGSGNVEKIYSSVLVFQGSAQLPSSIVTVLNCNLGTGAKSLSDLQAINGNYGSSTYLTSGNFVMSNSVYASGSNPVVAVNIDGKVATSEEAAKANPVDIYVERAVAKVKLTKKESYEVEDGIYAKILGWDVTTDTRTSSLLKVIDPTWDNTTLGFTWNDEPYHRSYWATTTATAVNDKDANSIMGQTQDYVYCQENTGSTHTNLIVVAQLQNASGNPVNIYKYYGGEYNSEADVLKAIANKYREMYYTKEETELVSISPNDMHFDANVANSGAKDYQVVAQLNDGVTIYNAEGTALDAANVNAELATNPADVTTDGYVYYFTPIKHLGTNGSTGEFGIVRNHIYDVNIESIRGTGTPIYDPDKIIIPTIPTDEDAYIAAQINVLAWRVVSSDVTLGQ